MSSGSRKCECGSLACIEGTQDPGTPPAVVLRMPQPAEQIDHVTITAHDLTAAQRNAKNADGFRHAHIGFVAPSRDAVDGFYAAALSAGGAPLAEPRDRPEFGDSCYNCYVTDAEGNGLEASYRPR
jgi:hypothetical protein